MTEASQGALAIGGALTLEAFVEVVRRGRRVRIGDDARARMIASRDVVERIVASGEPVYGVNTGFGRFQDVRIGADHLLELQRNLVLSHAIGVGVAFDRDVVRGMLLLRAQSLALGASGIRPLVVERLLRFLDAGVHPVIPSQGSVGASGDLAPLAHLAMAVIGEGEVEYGGAVRPTAEVLEELALEAIVLEAKEGLALINGTQAMGSLLALVLADAATLVASADVAASMSVEALRGSHRPFDPAVAQLRPHPGAIEVSDNLTRLLAHSEINASHAECDKVQDAYSLRAVVQVHGAVRDALRHARGVLDIEMASVTDNPLVFADEARVISAGNFHGEPLALAGDYVGIAIAELANISERRIEQMLNPALSGLPAFLAPDGGLHSGLMISQYTAAALVSENKVLAHPASVDSIPTSANQEDHVSMGTIACRKARSILDNASWVIAIEVMSAAQALDFHAPLTPGRGAAAAYARVRQELPYLDRDLYLRPGLDRVRHLVRSGELVRAAEAAAGPLA